jgi:quinolinate synthase
MENLVAGNPVNVISVDLETEKWAKVALDRMLALPSAASARD